MINRTPQKKGHLFSGSAAKYAANTVTETGLIGLGTGSSVIPANYFKEAGAPLHLMLMGGWSKGANTTLTLRVTFTQSGVTTTHHQKIFSNARLGGTVGGHWEIRAMCNVYAVGATGTMMMHAMLQLLENDSAEILGTHTETPSFTFDTTLPFEMDATAEWGTADVLNTIHSSNVMIW